MWETFGLRLWHPDDMRHISYSLFLSMAAGLDRQAAEDSKQQ